MFSVGATPYNSSARMRYGGWALPDAINYEDPVSGDPATDFQNYLSMKLASMYDGTKTPQERADYRGASSSIFNYYRGLGRLNPADPNYLTWKAIHRRWRPTQLRRGLSRQQKQALWDQFVGLDYDDNPNEAAIQTLQGIRQAPFRPLPIPEDIAPVSLANAATTAYYVPRSRVGRRLGYVRHMPQGVAVADWQRVLGPRWRSRLPVAPPAPPNVSPAEAAAALAAANAAANV